MDELSIVTKATADAHTLIIGYRVTNNSSRDAYLLNRLYRSTPHWDMSSDVAFVEFDFNSGMLRVSKRIPITPPGMTVTMPYAPYVTPVRAHSTFSELIHLPTSCSRVQAIRQQRTFARESTQTGSLSCAGLGGAILLARRRHNGRAKRNTRHVGRVSKNAARFETRFWIPALCPRFNRHPSGSA